MTSLEFETARMSRYNHEADSGMRMLAGVLILLAAAFVALGYISWRLLA